MFRKCMVVFGILLIIISINAPNTGGNTTSVAQQENAPAIQQPASVAVQQKGPEKSDKKPDYTISIPVGKRVLEPPKEVKKQRAVVEFFHAKHYTLTCIKCHHKWKGDAAIPKCGSSKCHNLAKPPKKEEIDPSKDILEISYYKKAYHDLCIGCHQDMKRKNVELESSYFVLNPKIEKTGPTACIKCHPKDLVMPGK